MFLGPMPCPLAVIPIKSKPVILRFIAQEGPGCRNIQALKAIIGTPMDDRKLDIGRLDSLHEQMIYVPLTDKCTQMDVRGITVNPRCLVCSDTN